MHRLHSGFTFADELEYLDAADWAALNTSIKELKKDAFEKSESTLFVSCSALPSQIYEGHYGCENLPATLLFSTTYCGAFKNHVDELIRYNKAGLVNILRFCRMFPLFELSDQELSDYLISHHHPGAFYSRYNCITKTDVSREKELRNEIENYIDDAQKLNAFNTLRPTQVKKLIQQHIITRGYKFEWSHRPARKNLIEFCVINRSPIAFAAVSLLIAGILLKRPNYWKRVFMVPFILVLLLLLILDYISSQKNDPATYPSDEKLRQIGSTQLCPILNEMTAIAPLKQGRLRRLFYMGALRVVHFFDRTLVNVPTVSSIRWLTVNSGKRLVFLSNYSNTTDFYVRDFLDGDTPFGVNFMFTNGEGFPDAKLQFKGGIRNNPEGYMHAVHTGQHPTQFTYMHEAHLTAEIINKNRKIRNGLFKSMNEEKARRWLKLL